MRNVWIGALNKSLSQHLTNLLQTDLDNIFSRLRVSTKFDAVLRAVDKCFSLPCNYPKGAGDEFKHWMRENHPGDLLVAVQQTSGSRQDLIVEGASAVYWNRRYYVEFLDESLRSKNDNILQENLFIILTSSEMITLSCVFSIIHFSISLPMRWLAGSTHLLKDSDWSIRSMGKAIDLLEVALMKIENDGQLFLSHQFMMEIFKEIADTVVPFRTYIQYMFEEKLTQTLPETETPKAKYNAAKVIQMDQLTCELFFPSREENKDTTVLATSMAVIMAKCWLKELRDPKKATSDYLTSVDGRFSWGNTSEEVHTACLGKYATNDTAETSFAGLTQQLQSYGRLLGVHASATGQAKINGDFQQTIGGFNKDGIFHTISKEMRSSLLMFALKEAPGVRVAEERALNKQREYKKRKKQILRKKKVLNAQRDYIKSLIYIEMYHSCNCWKSGHDVDREFSTLVSKNSKINALQEQIRIRVVGFGWKDLSHPWSKDGRDYTPEELKLHLVTIIIPEQAKRRIPATPSVNMPTRGSVDQNQLGTRSKDVETLDSSHQDDIEEFKEDAIELRKEEEAEWKLAQRPIINEDIVDQRVEVYFIFIEPDGTQKPEWCQGVVVGVKKKDTVHIKGDEQYLREDEPEVTEQVMQYTKWNKHEPRGWRLDVSS